MTSVKYKKACSFGDLTTCVECIAGGTFNTKAHFRMKIFDTQRSDFMFEQHCYTHGQLCPLFGTGTDSDLEVAGLPCTDQSSCGSQTYEEGDTMVVFICHAKRHVSKKTKMIVIENVQACAFKNISYQVPCSTSCPIFCEVELRFQCNYYIAI